MSQTHTAWRTYVVVLALLAAVSAVVAGCGSSSPASSTTSTAPTSSTAGSGSTTTTTAPRQGTVISLAISGGKVEGGVVRQAVKLGDEVTFRVVSDVDEELHVHGYDRKLALAPGIPVEVTFTADIPGVFEVELEHSGLKVAELQVA